MTEKNKSIRNFPNLRFPGFEEEKKLYKKHLFKDIFLFSTGKNIKQNEASPEFETSCVRYGELYHMYSEVIKEVINKTNLDKSELLFSQGDEILLPSAGEDPLDIGLASALTIANVAIGRTINILKPMSSDVYSQIYVSYYINHKLRRKISNLAKGSSISNVYNSDLKTLEIMLPSLNEQIKVANFLSLLDDRIHTQKKIIEGLIMQKNFIIKKLFKQNLSDLNTILLSDFLKIPEKVKANAIDKEKLLTVKLHLKGVHKNENSESLSLGATNYFIRKKGQFIYGKQNLFNGAFAIIPDKYDGFLSSADVPALDINENIINAKYLFYFFSRESFYKKLEDIASGSGSKRIHENTLLNITITLPSLAEQSRIADFLSKLDEKIILEKEFLTQYENQKKYLLTNLFV